MMTKTKSYRPPTKAERTVRFFNDLAALGFTYEESDALRRIQMTLHRWDEAECGDSNDYTSWAIERDEVTGKPFRCVYPHSGPSRRYPIADREKGALKRLEAIVNARNDREPDQITGFHQGDCRGCALYLVKASDIPVGQSTIAASPAASNFRASSSANQ